MKKLFFTIGLTLFLFGFGASEVSATGLNDVINTSTDTYEMTGSLYPSLPLQQLSLETDPVRKGLLIFSFIMNIIFYIAGIAATIMIVVAGVRLTFSAGTEEQIDGAKKMITYAVLGLVAIILAYLVVENIVKLLLKYD